MLRSVSRPDNSALENVNDSKIKKMIFTRSKPADFVVLVLGAHIGGNHAVSTRQFGHQVQPWLLDNRGDRLKRDLQQLQDRHVKL